MYKLSLLSEKIHNLYQPALKITGYLLCLNCRLQVDTEVIDF